MGWCATAVIANFYAVSQTPGSRVGVLRRETAALGEAIRGNDPVQDEGESGLVSISLKRMIGVTKILISSVAELWG